MNFYLLDSARMLPRQHAYLFWPIYQSFHDFHLTSARMLPRQHAYYFFLAYLAVFLSFWASQARNIKILRMLPRQHA